MVVNLRFLKYAGRANDRTSDIKSTVTSIGELFKCYILGTVLILLRKVKRFQLRRAHICCKIVS